MQSACNQVALSRFVPHAHQRAQHVAGRAPFANQTQSDAIKRTSELNTLPVERHLLRLFGRLELALARLLEMGERCAEIVDLLLELHLVLTKRDELLARPRHLPRVNRRLQLEAISRNQSQSPAARPSPHICVREGRNQQSQSPVGPPPMCPSPLADAMCAARALSDEGGRMPRHVLRTSPSTPPTLGAIQHEAYGGPPALRSARHASPSPPPCVHLEHTARVRCNQMQSDANQRRLRGHSAVAITCATQA